MWSDHILFGMCKNKRRKKYDDGLGTSAAVGTEAGAGGYHQFFKWVTGVFLGKNLLHHPAAVRVCHVIVPPQRNSETEVYGFFVPGVSSFCKHNSKQIWVV